MANKIPWFRDEKIMGFLSPKVPQMNTMTMPNNPMGVAPAGLVAAGEYVVGQDATQKIGPQNLDKMQEAVNGRPMKRGGQPVKGIGPMYGRMDDGGLVTKGRGLRGYGTTWTTEDAMAAAGYGKEGYVGYNSETSKTIADKYQLKDTQLANSQAINTRNLGSGAADESTLYANQQTQLANRQAIDARNLGTGAADESALFSRLATKKDIDTRNIGTGAADESALYASRIAKTGIKTPSAYEMANKRGLAGLSAIASGNSPLYRTLANLAQKQIATQGAMDQASLRQEMAQMGVTGGAANAMLADLGRDIGSQQATSAATTAVNAQKMAQEAMGQITTAGMEGMKFDYAKMNDAMNLAAQSGDYDTMASMASEAYGINVDVSKLKDAATANNFATAMSTLQTLGATYPDLSINSPGARDAALAIWSNDSRNIGKTPTDQDLANIVGGIRNSSNPYYRAMNSIPEDIARERFGSANIDSMQFNGMTGYPAFKAATADMLDSGGIKFNADGTWVTQAGKGNQANPLYKLLNNIEPAEPVTDTNIVSLFPQGTPPGTVRIGADGKNYIYDGTNVTEVPPVDVSGLSTTDFGELGSTGYDAWKKEYYTKTNTAFTSESIPALIAAAKTGNVNAQNDLTKTLMSNPPTLGWTQTGSYDPSNGYASGILGGGGPEGSATQVKAGAADKINNLSATGLNGLSATAADLNNSLSTTERADLNSYINNTIASRKSWATENIGKLPITNDKKIELLNKLGIDKMFWPDDLKTQTTTTNTTQTTTGQGDTVIIEKKRIR